MTDSYCGNYYEPQFGRTRTCMKGDYKCDACQLLDANDEIERLKAENAELRKDAERYRWLRVNRYARRESDGVMLDVFDEDGTLLDSDYLDAAIDAAMEGKI